MSSRPTQSLHICMQQIVAESPYCAWQLSASLLHLHETLSLGLESAALGPLLIQLHHSTQPTFLRLLQQMPYADSPL